MRGRAQLQPASGCVEPARGDAEDRLDGLLLEPVGGAEPNLLLGGGVHQHLLGQRRAVVGQPALGAHELDALLVTEPPQRLGAALRRETTAGDDDATGLAHRQPPPPLAPFRTTQILCLHDSPPRAHEADHLRS
jgi:hypothetical protein